MLKYFVIALVTLFFFPDVQRAEPFKLWIFQARIADCTNGQSIAFASIYNESSRTGVFADSSGFFKLQVEVGDTLIIQSMGYLGEVFFIPAFPSKTNDTLELCPQTYELGEVEVDLPLSYKSFQKRFMEIEPKRDLKIEGVPDPKILDIPLLLDTIYRHSASITPDGTVVLPFSYFYKVNMQNRKVFYLERQKREQFLIDKKYNRSLIEKMTGLKGDSITDFIAYCNFSHQFLYEATELEIVEMIDKKFNLYLRSDEKEW